MRKTQFKAGMYLLETLTSGMYNDPLSIYREYIQNAVDSIDQAKFDNTEDIEIRIELDPFEKSVSIFDNGAGISERDAESILSSIGSSQKLGSEQRGFRGIGRLGGIAFAQKVIFKTKAKGESTVSTQTWDCELLRHLLDSKQNSSMTIEELFSIVSDFLQEQDGDLKEKSFFEVKLLQVESYKNYIFDIQRIKKYLTQVAPLPFDPTQFSYSKEIKSFLNGNLKQYGEYKITINDESLYRPYKDNLKITSKKNYDFIKSVKLFSLESNGKIYAHGWYGCRKSLLGAIKKGESVSGLRVKVGNLQVGDNHLLDKCFREDRFNSYILGEIHVCNENLVPNSRRDDFVDNTDKTTFYNLVEIGLPFSKEIRQKSRKNVSVLEKRENKDNQKASIIPQKEKKQEQLGIETINKKNEVSKEFLEKLLKECGDCPKLQKILKNYSN